MDFWRWVSGVGDFQTLCRRRTISAVAAVALSLFHRRLASRWFSCLAGKLARPYSEFRLASPRLSACVSAWRFRHIFSYFYLYRFDNVGFVTLPVIF